jgi:hypothetical protein
VRFFTRLKLLYLTHFSKPIADRAIYRAIGRVRPKVILEIGVGSGARALRMIGQLQMLDPTLELRYVGIDQFEARPKSDVPSLTLKEAHSLLRATPAKVQAVPGDPLSALSRVANSLKDVDLVIISHDQHGESLDRSWFFLPRTLHDKTVVMQEVSAGDGAKVPTKFVEVSRGEIDTRAQQFVRKRAA